MGMGMGMGNGLVVVGGLGVRAWKLVFFSPKLFSKATISHLRQELMLPQFFSLAEILNFG